MKIIKIQKMSNNKYKIILDNDTLVTFDNVILKYNLLYKKELTKEELNEINKESNYYDAYNKALKFSTNKVRCKTEVEKYINRFILTDKEKTNIVNRLKELNIINDEIYCRTFISDKIHLSKYGKGKIKNMLLKQNIDINIINNELDKINIEELNFNLENKVKKKIQSNHKYSNYELRNKLVNYFMNEGYDKEKIIYYIDRYQKDDTSILEKEFDKLYYKCKNKYDSKTLEMKIKQKLTQKGFPIDLINHLLQEKTEE